MLEKDEFERWIEASHMMFEIFEGRYDAYPLAKKWVQEWFLSKKFTIDKKDVEIIDCLIQDFNYDAFRNFRDRIERDNDTWKNLVSKANQQFKRLRENDLNPSKCENVGFAVAPFLFTWNFQRFKEYFKRRENLNLEQYFVELGIFLEDKKVELEFFKTKKIIADDIENEKIERIFQEINAKLAELGIRDNEPIGTTKLLHVFAPHYFPLIDNKIAKATGLLPYKRGSLTSQFYIKWMNTLKNWLQNYIDVIEKLQNNFHSSILKLIDEGLYLMSSVKLRLRVAELGLEVK
jgi:hypothetical protein